MQVLDSTGLCFLQLVKVLHLHTSAAKTATAAHVNSDCMAYIARQAVWPRVVLRQGKLCWVFVLLHDPCMLHTVQGHMCTLCTARKPAEMWTPAAHPALKASALKSGAQLRAFAGYGSLAGIQQPRLFDALVESVPCLHQERAAAGHMKWYAAHVAGSDALL